MPRLLSGSTLRRGGSGEFLDLKGAMPQLPATDTTLTGFTLVTNSVLQTSYKSSLGFIEFSSATMHSSLPKGTIRILNSGTDTISTGTQSGLLVVEGDVGVEGTMNIWKDITVNGITIGRGYEFGINNIVIRGNAEPQVDNFENGQESIAIGYDTLKGIADSYKSLAIGRYALSSGTGLSNNIALGDSALKVLGVTTGTLNDSNVAVGVDAGLVLKDGQQNVFIGHQAANLLTTGSYNIIIGPITGQYLYTGSGIISIGGDNIVDGLDNQVNIGSVFYYDGTGYSYISSDVNLGLGTTARVASSGTFSSSSTVTGGLVVVGGIFGWDNLVLVNNIEIMGSGTNTFTGSVSVGGVINVLSTSTSTFAGPIVPSQSGATLGTFDNPFSALYVSGNTVYVGTVTLKAPSSTEFKIESVDGYVTQTVGNLRLNSGAVSTSYSNGSLVVTGGIGLAGGFNVGGTHDVDISPTAATVYIKPSGGGSVDIRPNSVGYMDNMIIGQNDSADATFDSIYSSTLGNPDESSLVYSPKVTVTTGTPPANPRVGDVWINARIPAYLQYIKDGANKIWVQIGAI